MSDTYRESEGATATAAFRHRIRGRSGSFCDMSQARSSTVLPPVRRFQTESLLSAHRRILEAHYGSGRISLRCAPGLCRNVVCSHATITTNVQALWVVDAAAAPCRAVRDCVDTRTRISSAQLGRACGWGGGVAPLSRDAMAVPAWAPLREETDRKGALWERRQGMLAGV
jgi:hypothetical protein